MTEETVNVPKMRRTSDQKKNSKISILNLSVMVFCVLLLTASTFLNLQIKHFILPLNIFGKDNLTSDSFVRSFYFIPQIPVLLFICSAIGRKLSITSTVIYIITGLFFAPVFALGGGLKYIAQFGFGYIIGYIPAVNFAGKFLSDKYSFPDMLKAAISGVLIIHLCGIFYMLVLAIIKHSAWNFVEDWICAQSGVKIIYDFILSFILIMIGRYINAGFKYLQKN